jgi:transketolase
MIGMAAGLALRGRIPVVHALAAFLTMRAFEFIRTDIGIAGHPVKLVGYIPGILSEANGPTHQALEDIALMRGIPGMHVFCPADKSDMMNGLSDILTDPNPWYIRYNDRPPVVEHNPDQEIGKAEVFNVGFDVTLISYGPLFEEAKKTQEILESEGISTGLVNMRMLHPVDEMTFLRIARTSEYIVTIEDHFEKGGLFSVLAETLLKHKVTAHAIPFAFRDRWFKPLLYKDVLAAESLHAEAISSKLINTLQKRENSYAQSYSF